MPGARVPLLCLLAVAAACGPSPRANTGQAGAAESLPIATAVLAYEPTRPVPSAPEPLSVAEVEAAPRPEPPGWLRLRFVGDVIFGRYRDGSYQSLAHPGAPVFAKVLPLLDGDWAVANLETPLLPAIPQTNTRPGYFFGATKEMATPLVDAGFDAVSLGNNHAADLGVSGLRQTPVLLRELGIEPIGAARDPGVPLEVRSLDISGTRVAALSVTARANFELPETSPNVAYVPEHQLGVSLGPLVSAAAQDHDLVVLLLHWGVEYARYPEAVQRAAARTLVDAGADVVIGHHPHVLQEIELYRGAVVAYSLGNFLFGNTAPDPRLTGVLGIDVERGAPCRVRVRFDPAVIRAVPYVHPMPATGQSAEAARRRVRARDPAGRGRWQREGEALVTEVHRERCPGAPG